MAAEGFWRYVADPRNQAAAVAAASAAAGGGVAAQASLPAAPAAVAAAAPSHKRSRPDFELQARPDMVGFYGQDERPVYPVRETEALAASYDRYLRNGMPPVAGELARPVVPGAGGFPVVDDPRMMGVGGVDGRNMGYGGARPDVALPPDASNTLFVVGLPQHCTRREVSHIFRPFVGFREVRLVNKESRHNGEDPLVLCFVDFENAAQAATAMEALQGYKFDEHDRESPLLRIQFARFAGPRSGGGSRGRR